MFVNREVKHVDSEPESLRGLDWGRENIPTQCRPTQMIMTSRFGRLPNASKSPTIDHYPHSPRAIMSDLPSPSTSSNLESVFNAALTIYKKKTGKDIASHPLATELQSCNSPDAILAVLLRQIPTPDRFQSGHETFTECLIPIVNVLYTLSDTLGEGVGLVIITMPSLLRTCAQTSFSQAFSPPNVIFAGIGVLLLVGYPLFSLRSPF